MGRTRNPRHGTLQFWPRKRARRPYARIRHFPVTKEAKALGFAGYKAGMTHVIVIDNRPNSMTKGEELFLPVTIIECPALKIAGIRFYKQNTNGLFVSGEVWAKTDKELKRKSYIPKKEHTMPESGDYADVRLLAYTQPKLTGVGKKKPEVFELGIGGSVEEKLKYAKEKLGREIKINDVFKEGEQVDIFAVSKGKGFQGPVKRFGISLKQHKTEKGIRGVGNVGSWTGPRSWTVAHAGQMGYHSRMERNKSIIKIIDNPAEINPKGGFLHYGFVKSQYMLIKGSIPGTTKRLIRFVPATRKERHAIVAPSIEYVSLESKQAV